eukprot:TRINITY_DN11764_c0_g1_i1.p2 TRINITY_DN11764_c0_g1~~TRINITY_DN11764_c0_g1_i1.p2  ORF type:complete len:316 (-),score=75.33 TRINITY_DN11764_c0_g1_i1:192-1139(-)
MFRRTSQCFANVCVIGASGGIGQPLALLLKSHPAVTRLSLFDLAHTPGVAADLSHICTPAKVSGYIGDDLSKALDGAEIVVVPAGVPRKPGMTRDDLFNMNASVVANVAENVAKTCPNALVCIITNPVNSTVPIFAEVMKKYGKHDPRRVFGVTSLDLVRAKTFVNELKGVDCDVPVIGGHSGPTIVPLLSQVQATFSEEELASLTKRIQYAGDEVVNAKAGAGSATLSMAFAGYRFVRALLDAREKNVTEYAFVETDVEPSLSFFATKVTLSKDGVVSTEKPPKLSSFEESKYADCVKQLTADIKKGQDWARAK